MESLSKPHALKNTKLNTQWAMNNFSAWWKWHNNLESSEKCPEVLMTPKCSAEDLNQWLPVCVGETRNKEGKRYSPKTIYSLLTGVLRNMSTENPHYPNFLEKSNPQFFELEQTQSKVLLLRLKRICFGRKAF